MCNFITYGDNFSFNRDDRDRSREEQSSYIYAQLGCVKGFLRKVEVGENQLFMAVNTNVG